jgi:hypothetical protein
MGEVINTSDLADPEGRLTLAPAGGRSPLITLQAELRSRLIPALAR